MFASSCIHTVYIYIYKRNMWFARNKETNQALLYHEKDFTCSATSWKVLPLSLDQ